MASTLSSSSASANPITTVFLSDGTQGACFGRGKGLNKLSALLTQVNVKERPLYRMLANVCKKIGSGKYPYKTFLEEYLWAPLREQLEKGPVLMVCYSFSCRAAGLMFQLFSEDDLELVKRNLRGIVFLSPPANASKGYIDNDRPAPNGGGNMDSDWAQSYGLIAPHVPMHFVIGQQTKKRKLGRWTKSVFDACGMFGPDCTCTWKEIEGSDGMFVGYEEQVAAFIGSLLPENDKCVST